MSRNTSRDSDDSHDYYHINTTYSVQYNRRKGCLGFWRRDRRPSGFTETTPHTYGEFVQVETPTFWASLTHTWMRWQWACLGLGIVMLLLAWIVVTWVFLKVANSDDDSGRTMVVTATPGPGDLTATSSPVPSWPPDAVFEPQTIPAQIRHALDAPAATHGYTFTGIAGTIWEIAVAPYQGSGTDPVFRLYGPDGSELTPDGQPVAFLTFTLPDNGTYRVLIGSASGTATGYYWLTVAAVG
ncbi:MAG: hypothetical protein JXQ72_13940 [Anaerolineae bacterium]|nr:hypothetical protein [Anaerolineae bacterium]